MAGIKTAWKRKARARQENCMLCGMYMNPRDRTIDHILPLSVGGTNRHTNLQVVHTRCNMAKGELYHKTKAFVYDSLYLAGKIDYTTG